MLSYRSFHRFKDIPKGVWSQLLQKEDYFLSEEFLVTVEKHHQAEIGPIYTLVEDEKGVVGILYAQVFDFKNKKLNNYIESQKFNLITRLKSQMGRLLKLKVAFLGNVFMSNEPAFKFKKGHFTIEQTEEILSHIQKFSGTKFLLIPDFYKDAIDSSSRKIKQISVEPDMYFEVSKDWNDFDDYLTAIRSKYKKRYHTNQKISKSIVQKIIEPIELLSKAPALKALFAEVYENSNFNSVKFNTDMFLELNDLNKNICIHGYYNGNDLLGFSSVFKVNRILYAHFVGFSYEKNHKYDLYSKMLYDHIRYAIDHDVELMKLGRTACEFKSNFGAKPHLEKGYVYDKTGRYLYFLGPFLDLLKPKAWVQRKPFKEG